MTQAEKAKAYDEALERMKSWVRGEHPECFTEAQKAAEFIFPELKKSEDEKIWFEKQGEKQELGGTFVNVDEVREIFMNTIYSVLSDDPTNDRANDIINAFDNLPSITINV